jgi:hypothetical protein
MKLPRPPDVDLRRPSQIARVDTDDARAQRGRAPEGDGLVGLEQHTHVHGACVRHQGTKLVISQSLGDEQDRIRAGSTRFDDLLVVNDHVLAEDGHRR